MASEEEARAVRRDLQPVVIDGEREALERRMMWAILFDHPEKERLARQLTPAANSTLVLKDPSE
ncbi:hypothetical protein [Piscinibacter defluvii]|jgi:hypothetical protein|uniref:hypothetical protein n=1 Tax=Piscinibacter defluvii TaxID=1796922 RepID=UPI000FDDCC4A|nr:hypothetical protein [Piscinibacter defluvii]